MSLTGADDGYGAGLDSAERTGLHAEARLYGGCSDYGRVSWDGGCQHRDGHWLVLFLGHRQRVLGLQRLRQRRAGAHLIQILIELRRQEG